MPEEAGVQALRDLIEPVLSAMGYELVYLEVPSGGGLVRLYIDSPAGITLDDCESVSRQVSGILDVEDPIPGSYRLEVSSPGLDRPLVKPAHFRQFAGERVAIKLRVPNEGRRRYTGTLLGIEADEVIVDVDGARHRLPLTEIRTARLVPDLQGRS